VILRYHTVSDFRKHEVNVKKKAFEKQMAFIARYQKSVSLKEALEALKNKEQLPKNAVVVTFDDGYKDNYTNAYAILRQFNAPAIIFLTAGYIGTNKILPHDKFDNPAYNNLLSWYEAREMAQGGIDFGSHTIRHANLGRSGTDIKSEIEDSKKIIEKELGRSIWAISYPFGLVGNFNQQTKYLVSQAGYVCGCSAMNGLNDARSDIFELRRIGIEASDNMFTFKAKLNGALDLLEIKDWPVFNGAVRILNRIIGV
jgi:peptidoglycan/xylan/chitin deacetylase (PgdA/CDA1 family)